MCIRDRFRPEAAPDVIKTLLEEFVQQVPSPAHRVAPEACALARLMTESLLATMLRQPDAHDLFDWLRGLSFIEADRRGIFPHDLAREALCADLKWRDPDGYAELHNRARAYHTQPVPPRAGPWRSRPARRGGGEGAEGLSRPRRYRQSWPPPGCRRCRAPRRRAVRPPSVLCARWQPLRPQPRPAAGNRGHRSARP